MTIKTLQTNFSEFVEWITEFGKALEEGFIKLFNPEVKKKESVRSASVIEYGKSNYLNLDLQFFAEPGDEKKGEGKGKDNPENNKDQKEDPDDKNLDDDPEDLKDEEPSLKELFKKHPKLKEQYSERFQNDFNKRLKGLDLEEAKKAVALLDKLGLNAEGIEKKVENEDTNQFSVATTKLEKKAKDLSFKLYVANEGLDSALISELASAKVQGLDLNDDGELDSDDIDEVIEELKTRFPQIFTEKKADDKSTDSFSPGGRQKTNPVPSTSSADEKAIEVYERIRNKKKK